MLDRTPSDAATRRRELRRKRKRRRELHRLAQQRRRKRERAGRFVLDVEIGPLDVDKLVRLEYLGAHEVESRKRIAAAVAHLLDRISLD